MKATITERLKGCGVLIVDDNKHFCEGFKNYLNLSGFTRILTAYDGRQAIEIISEVKDKIYVMTLDMCMEAMDGFELMRHLANRHPFHVGIVLVTGYGLKENRDAFIKAGSEKIIPINFCIKPTPHDELLNEVVSAIQLIAKKRLSSNLINCPDNVVSKDIKLLIDELKIRDGLSSSVSDDLIGTLEELMLCFSNNCYLASMGLSGRLLEIILKNRMLALQADYDDNWPIGALLTKISEIEPSNTHSLSALKNIANIINKYRIGAVHSKKDWAGPSRESTIMVLYGIIELLKAEIARIEPDLRTNSVVLKTSSQNKVFINKGKNASPILPA